MVSEVQMNDQQKELVELLRGRLKNEVEPHLYNDASVFYRFLKARNFNLDAAEKMFRKHIEWRKKWDVENILKEYKAPEVLEKYMPCTVIGYDTEGFPCRYTKNGNIDMKGILMSCNIEDLERYTIYINELDTRLFKEQSVKMGKVIDKCSYICDFADMSFAKATDKENINVMIRMVTLYQDNFPEHLKDIYVINSSTYFTMLFSVVKYFVAASVLEKIHFLGADNWKEELCKVFDPDVLPAFLGGNKTDPDGNPLCKTFICHGGIVPESYYLRERKTALTDVPEGYNKLTIARASFKEMTINIEEPSSLIEWKFSTKCRDIGFGVFYQEIVDGEEKITELIPLQRIDTHEYPETGIYRCEKTGTYIMLFDNSYSWIRSKDIHYKLAVVNPKDHEVETME